MAEEQAGGKGSKLVGLVRAGFTALFGLVSGAALMYFSPLLDKVIKPGKPVANFQAETDGLKVVFHNRSSGGSDGWWDFGDGSALEPFQPGQETVTHTFARPGVYAVKLSLRSLFGEENERTVNVALEGTTAAAAPAIEAFEVIPIRPDTYAPATFKVVSKVKNAELCVWAPGAEQPLEVIGDVSGTQERYVTLRQPGTHTLRLAAYGGKQVVEKAQTVRVEQQPPGTLMAVLHVTHQAVHVDTRTISRPTVIDFPPQSKDRTWKFTREIVAEQGFLIADARFAVTPQGPMLKGAPALQILPDRRKVRLTGELVRTSNTPPKWVAPVVLRLERREAPVTRPMAPVAATLTVPGTTLLPISAPQGGWVSSQRSLAVEVREGTTPLWQCQQTPRTDDITLRGQRYRLSATEANGQLRIDVVQVRGVAPVGN